MLQAQQGQLRALEAEPAAVVSHCKGDHTGFERLQLLPELLRRFVDPGLAAFCEVLPTSHVGVQQ